MIAHLAEGFVKKKVEMALTKNKAIISGKPVSDPLLIRLLKDIVKTGPILLFLKTLIRIDPSSMRITVRPIPSNE